MKISFFTRFGVLGALLLMTIGCGGESSPPQLTKVQGKVTYRGRPLHTGTIVFTPDQARGNRGDLSQGDILPNGTFQLCSGKQSGAQPGWHRVTIVAIEDRIVPGQRNPVPQSILPDKYRDPDLSGLSCEVKAGQDNVINFNLDR